MTFKNLTYKQKNKLLLLAVLIILLISWSFSFSKAWGEYRQNTELTTQNTTSVISNQITYTTQQKFNNVDSLVKKFSIDSIAFENNFLSDISQCIEGLPIELSFNENNKASSDIYLQSKSITLQGDYKSIIKAIDRIEGMFFIGSVNFEKDKYTISIQYCPK